MSDIISHDHLQTLTFGRICYYGLHLKLLCYFYLKLLNLVHLLKHSIAILKIYVS